MPGMTKREVVRTVLEHRRPPYVPWSFGFTVEARAKLLAHAGSEAALEELLQNHLLRLGNDIGFFEPAGTDRVRDAFGVVWNREVDKDIGIVEGTLLPAPTLAGYDFPDPRDDRFFADIPSKIAERPDLFRVYSIGFSLFERAWTMRGMENLLVDFYEQPGFVRDLFGAIGDYNLAQVDRALEYDIDAVYFGDDWGQQHGLIMGPVLWREMIKPTLARMYGRVKSAGKHVMIHSCGDVDELFDDLIEIGLDCFNPFQPEVMDVYSLLPAYRSRLSFHGGLSTQRTLPYGTPDDVRRETSRLIAAGAAGGYILSPAHDVEGDVSIENMLAFIETAKSQLTPV
jgi:uroporphyrinogen decarboxylase